MNPGALIRDARAEAGLTQTELAERGGTSQATVSAYESGRKVPSATTLARLLAASGHGLAAVGGKRPVITPSAEAHRRVARGLRDVLALAESLPSRPPRRLRYPRLEPVAP